MTTISTGVTIPARIHLQEVTCEYSQTKSTRPLLMDLKLFSIPVEGERLRLRLPIPGWWLKVSSARWHIVESHYHVSVKLIRDDGLSATVKEIESVLMQAGFQVNSPLLLLMQLMDSSETEGMNFDELLCCRDERLREQGYQEAASEVDRSGWASVRLLVHEVEYGDDESVSGEIPPLSIETSIPFVPITGDQIGVGDVPELFAVGNINSEVWPGGHVARLHACMPIEDYERDTMAFRAAGFLDCPTDD